MWSVWGWLCDQVSPTNVGKGSMESSDMRSLCGDNEDPRPIPSSPRLHPHQEGPVDSSSTSPHSAQLLRSLFFAGSTPQRPLQALAGVGLLGVTQVPELEVQGVAGSVSSAVGHTSCMARDRLEEAEAKDGPGS